MSKLKLNWCPTGVRQSKVKQSKVTYSLIKSKLKSLGTANVGLNVGPNIWQNFGPYLGPYFYTLLDQKLIKTWMKFETQFSKPNLDQICLTKLTSKFLNPKLQVVWNWIKVNFEFSVFFVWFLFSFEFCFRLLVF